MEAVDSAQADSLRSARNSRVTSSGKFVCLFVCRPRSPISQFFPVKLLLHQHKYELTPSSQTAPFWQGGGLHWSPSVRKHVNRKAHRQQQTHMDK